MYRYIGAKKNSYTFDQKKWNVRKSFKLAWKLQFFKYLRNLCLFLLICPTEKRHKQKQNVLTVEANCAICFTTRIFGHALIRAVILFLYIGNRKSHVRFIWRRPNAVVRSVFLAFVDHVSVLPGPVIEWRGMRLSEALQGDTITEWCTDQLVRDPQHRRNCNKDKIGFSNAICGKRFERNFGVAFVFTSEEENPVSARQK